MNKHWLRPWIKCSVVWGIGLLYTSISLGMSVVFPPLAFGAEIPSQTPDPEEALAEIMRLQRAGQYPEAIVAAEALLQAQASQWGKDDPQLFQLFNLLGILHKAMGHWEQAEEFYRRLLEEVDWASIDPLGQNRGITLHNLAELYRSQARYAEAEPLYEEALNLLEPELGSENPTLLIIRNNQAELFRAMGNLEYAERLHLSLAIDRERILGANHPDLGTSWYNLASIAVERNQLEEAKALLSKALAVKKATYGTTHPDVASVLNLLGLIQQQQGDLESAAQFLEQVLNIRQTLWGQEHPLIAHIFNNLAVLAQAEEDFPKAKEYIAQALDIAQRTLGSDHPDTNKIRANQETLFTPPNLLNPSTLLVFSQ